MEFTIYSVGSAHYLGEILNSVAMIAGSGNLAASAKIGMLIGVFIIAFQAVVQGTGVQFQKAGVCLIIYMAMFGASSRALIQDAYTGEVVVVDNVPIGPLAAGSIVSTIGFKITEEMEQAFSTPAMTKYGFADPLNVLVTVRQSAMNMQNAPTFNTPNADTDLISSWGNYIRECTMVNVAANPARLSEIYSAADPIQALEFQSSLYGTRVYINGAQDLTCSEAYVALHTAMDDQSPSMFAAIGPELPNYTTDGVQAEERITNAIYQLGLNMESARKFTQAAVLLPIVQGGPQAKAIADQQGNAAVMMNQAFTQQNTQWAAEGNLFTKYARPFMTFFEGFIYAITPLVAFIIVLGPQGISLVGKYLLILAWLMLWFPIMAIVNLYLNVTVTQQIADLVTYKYNGAGNSFAVIMEMEQIIEKQLGVAGLMLSSVPGLVMFLLYGTSVAATSLAGRLNGSDQINEKLMAPDLAQPGTSLAMSAQYQNDPTSGTRQTGSSTLLPSVDVGSSLSREEQSAESREKSATQAWSREASTSSMDTLSNSASMSSLAQLGSGLQTNSTQELQAGTEAAVSHLKEKGFSQSEAQAAAAAYSLGANASGGIGGSANGLNGAAGISGAVSKNTNISKEQQERISQGVKELESSTVGQNLKATLQDSKSQQFAEALQNNKQLANTVSGGSKLAETASEMLSAKQSHSDVMKNSQSYGVGTRMDLATLANQSDASAISKKVDELGLGEKVNELLPKMQSFIADPTQAKATAGLMAMIGNGHTTEMLQVTGMDRSGDAAKINPSTNQNIETANATGVRDAAANQHGPDKAGFRAEAAALGNKIDHYDDGVMHEYQKNRTEVNDTAADMQSHMKTTGAITVMEQQGAQWNNRSDSLHQIQGDDPHGRGSDGSTINSGRDEAAALGINNELFKSYYGMAAQTAAEGNGRIDEGGMDSGAFKQFKEKLDSGYDHSMTNAQAYGVFHQIAEAGYKGGNSADSEAVKNLQLADRSLSTSSASQDHAQLYEGLEPVATESKALKAEAALMP